MQLVAAPRHSPHSSSLHLQLTPPLAHSTSSSLLLTLPHSTSSSLPLTLPHSTSSSLPSLYLTPAHSTSSSLLLTPSHSTSLYLQLTPPHSTSLHLTPPHSTSLHLQLTPPHSTSLPLTLPHSTSLQLTAAEAPHACQCLWDLQCSPVFFCLQRQGSGTQPQIFTVTKHSVRCFMVDRIQDCSRLLTEKLWLCYLQPRRAHQYLKLSVDSPITGLGGLGKRVH